MIARIVGWSRATLESADGQGLVEHGPIIVLVSLAAMAALSGLSEQIDGRFGAVTAALP